MKELLVRSFVAVEISEPVRKQIAELLSQLRPTASGVRWVKPERMHLTLAFLGEVPERFLKAAQGQLGPAAAESQAFSARLSGLGAFPSPGRARVVWVGMDEGKDELCRLQRATVQALRQVGYKPEQRPFSPHLTLGRLREPADVSAACQEQFQSESFPVDRLILFQSVLSSAGPEYTPLGSFPLGRP